MLTAILGMLLTDPLLEAAIERGKRADEAGCAFTVTERNVTTDEGSGEVEDTSERVMRYEPGAGWRLLSVDGAEPDADALAAFAEEDRGVPGEEGEGLEGLNLADFPFERVDEGGGMIEFEAARWPREVLDVLAEEDANAERFAKRSVLRLAVRDEGEPMIAVRTISLTEPFRVKMVAKIHAADFRSEFAEVEGRVLPQTDTAAMRFAAFGDVKLNDTEVTYTDYACPPLPEGESPAAD